MVGGLSRRSRRRGGLTRGGCAAVLAALALIATACGAEVDFEAQQADFADQAQDALDAAIERRAVADDAEEEESKPPPTADPAISSTPASSQSDFCTASADVFVAATAFDFLATDDSPYRTSVAASDLTTSIDAAIAAAPDAEAAAPAEALAASWQAIHSSLEIDHSYNWASYARAGAGDADLAQFGEIAGTALPGFLASECAIATQDDADIERQVQSQIDTWAGVADRLVVVDDNDLIELSLPYLWEIDSASDQTVAWVHAAPVLADAETTWDADGVFFTMFPVKADVSAEDWMESAIASSAAAQDCEENNFIRNPGSFEAYFVCIGPEVDAIVVAEHDQDGVGVLLEGQWDQSQSDFGDAAMIQQVLGTRQWLIDAGHFGAVPGSREAATLGRGGPGSAYWDLEPGGDPSSFCDASVASWIMFDGFEQADLLEPAVLEAAMTNIDLSIQSAILQAPDRDTAVPAYIMGDAWSSVVEITRDDYGWRWALAIADGDALDAGAAPAIARATELRENLRAVQAVREQLAEFLDVECDQPTDTLAAAGSSIAANWNRDFSGKAPTTGPQTDGGEVGVSEVTTVSSSDGRVSVSVPTDWQSDEQPGDRQYSWILSPDITAASESGRIDAVRFVFVEELDELDGWLEFSRQGNAQVRRGCVETGDASVAEGDVLRTTFLYDCDGAPAVVVSLFDARAPSGLLIQVQSSDDRPQDEALDWIEETLDSVMWDAPTP